MPEKRFQEVGLNVATNHREPSAEEILIALSKAGQAISPKELAEMSGYPLTTVKKCLNILKREGLAIQHRDGLRINYTLRGK
jgi:DNA-binding IclR family transcriptional regulator